MIFEIELFVKLKIPDVAAVTAKNTLQRRMGYKNILLNLEREDYYKILANLKNIEEAEKIGKELAEKSNIFVNPNKHKYRLEIKGKKKEKNAQQKEKVHLVKVLVNYLEDGTSFLILDSLKNRFNFGKKILDLKRGILWTLTISAKNQKESLEKAKEIVLTRSREKGLLVNPHFQSFKII